MIDLTKTMINYTYPKYNNRSDNPYRRKGKDIIIAVFKDPIMKIYHRLFKKFDFNGKTYSNLYHYYNTTWRNERTVEVPITKRIVDEYKAKKSLNLVMY